ncbi:hypothetical protein SBRCBS47491_004692 [Sporothrix bragantina]|uniref:Zn(2)-C6 fungal-type domain-containing protein n=1 Tax=Sporothrix bragantina TaxID=671064 RepID=A0ABP0BS87_9PEZI
MSSPPANSPKVGKQRHTKSCKRCTRRKQRCHGFPVCRACDEAKVPCEPSAYAIQLHAQDGYSGGGSNNNGSQAGYAAMQRIQALETQLAGALAELAVVRQQQCTPNPFLLDNRTTEPIPLLFGDADDTSTLIGSSNGGNHGGNGIPGTVEQMVQSTVWSKGLFSVGDGGPPMSPLSPISPMPPLTSFSSAPQLPQQLTATATHLQPPQPSIAPTVPSTPPPPPQPTDAMGRRMIDAYFAKIHPRYPFLDRNEVYALHETAQRQTTPPPPSTSLSLAQRFKVFRLNMVYAIGGTLLKITDPLCEAQAETYLAVALRDVAVVQDAQAHSQSHGNGNHNHGRGSTLLTIEGLVLLVLYNLRAPTNTGIWYLTNLAMQTCIDLRLHMEASYHDASLTENERRTMRRLFWSAYVLDRFIALSFKRPFSIAENDIETAITDGTTDGAMWRRFIEIKRLESRIQTSVYGHGEPREQRCQKIAPLLAEVDAWGKSISTPSSPPSPLRLTPSEVVYLQLQWNSAVAQILRPFLSTMDRDDPLLVRCLHASGNVCALFKAMHMREAYGHSFVSAHLTFIAGVTMCYCLFRVAGSSSSDDSGRDKLARLLDARVATNLRACSSSMFMIAERYHRLRKHRDILEDIIGRIMEARMRPGSSGSNNNNTNKMATSAPARLPTRTAAAPPSRDQFSQLDFVAVQSLLNLAAQQEPETCTSPDAQATTITGTGPSETTAAAAFTSIVDSTDGGQQSSIFSLSPPRTENSLHLQPHPALELNFAATGSWDVDRYSLEMLGRMIEPG